MNALNKAGEAHLRSLIEAGKYDAKTAWSFDDAADGNALLGDGGDNWARYGNVHLGVDSEAADKTKAHWKYPAAKAKGAEDEVYRSGLIAAKQRATGQGDKEIEDAASALIDLIDEKEKGDSAGAAAKVGAARRAALRAAGLDLPRIATRIFGTPLLISAPKLEVMLSVLGPRLGLGGSMTAPTQAMWDDDDSAFDDPNDKPYAVTPDGIAQICVDGTLVYKSSWLGALSGLTAYADVGDAVKTALADPAVKGILLQVDSYGGEVNGCFDLSDAIFAARAVKPLYTVAADNAFSAGYALAAAGEKLFVSRTSGVGSIGVVAMHVDESGADAQDGLKYTYIYSGDHKVDGNEHEPLSDPAREAIQADCDRLRALFAASVAKYRGVTAEAMLATQAAGFFGENAVAAKLADAVGTPADALVALSAEIARRSGTSAVNQQQPNPQQQPQQQPPSAEVIDLAKVRGEGATAAAKSALEIVDLCVLAGFAGKAAEFIRGGMSLEHVREALQKAKADAADVLVTRGHLSPGGNSGAQASGDGWDRAISNVTGKPIPKA
jgi:ClpP class serine protease